MENKTTKECKVSFSIKPLSNRGEFINGYKLDSENQYLVKWGQIKFPLDSIIFNKILKGYFTKDKWYPLGASMTDPTPRGLGEFVSKNFQNFTPRHASAIAAILVHCGDLEFKGRRPIYLRKIPLSE